EIRPPGGVCPALRRAPAGRLRAVPLRPHHHARPGAHPRRAGGAAGHRRPHHRHRRHGQCRGLPHARARPGRLSPVGGADRLHRLPLGPLRAARGGAARDVAHRPPARGDAGGRNRHGAPALRVHPRQRRGSGARLGRGPPGARAHRALRGRFGHRVRFRHLPPHHRDAHGLGGGGFAQGGARRGRHPVLQRPHGGAGRVRVRAQHAGPHRLLRPRRQSAAVGPLPVAALLLAAPRNRRGRGAGGARLRACPHAPPARRERRALAGRKELGAAPRGVGLHARDHARQRRPARPRRLRAPPERRLDHQQLVAAHPLHPPAGGRHPALLRAPLPLGEGGARSGRIGGARVGGQGRGAV
ncbi:MAG: hypothetical protein AVDCRST_MAG89-3751, partial [uncultured Gemmatimonadetes bacterium]